MTNKIIRFFQSTRVLKRDLILHTGFEEGTREFSLGARVDSSRVKERREGRKSGGGWLEGEEESERERERSKMGHDARVEHRW